MDEETEYIVILIGYALFAALLLWGVIYSIRLFYKYSKAASWTRTQGMIVSSKITIDDSGDGVAYIPDISYSYCVNGNNYTSKSVYFFGLWLTKRQAEYLTGKFKQGDSVEVFVNPKDPEEATLITGFNQLHFNAFFGVLFMLVVGLVFLIVFIYGLINWI